MALEEVPSRNQPQVLRLFCSRCPGGFLVHVHPAWVPRNVQQCLDKDWEGMAELDFEQLERQMQRAGLTYGSHRTATGSIELEADGEAAVVMGSWLASMFTSGVR